MGNAGNPFWLFQQLEEAIEQKKILVTDKEAFDKLISIGVFLLRVGNDLHYKDIRKEDIMVPTSLPKEPIQEEKSIEKSDNNVVKLSDRRK